jgi:hypothetical protein
MAAEEMEDLASRYADRAVRSAFIYTREAHPGENYRHHTSMDDKRANARAFQEHSGIKRQILLDDLDGTAHHTYGQVPNMTWIIGRGGFILYKAAWTGARDVESGLLQALDFQENRVQNKWLPFYSERAAFSYRDMSKFKEGLERAGPQAVSDFAGPSAQQRTAAETDPEAIPSVPGNFFKPGTD